MSLKDYYKTLDVQPTASLPQIKKSFRQLALLHHPDKNPGNIAAEARFKEIQEAYETLVDPAKREAYNYKRWYSRSIKEPFVYEPLDPASVLIECTRLSNYMHSVNALGIDFDGLSHHIRQLLSDKNIGILQQGNDETINAGVIEKILAPAAVLPFRYIEPIASRLLRIAGNNDILTQQVNIFLQQQKQKNNWHRYNIVLVMAITVLLCWIIYTVSR